MNAATKRGGTFVLLVGAMSITACGNILGIHDIEPPAERATDAGPGDVTIPAEGASNLDGGLTGDGAMDGMGETSDVNPSDGGNDSGIDSGPQGDAFDAGLTPDSGIPCTNVCTINQTACNFGGVQTCETQANGCAQWVTTSTCGASQTCTATGVGAASCTCKATLCTEVGTVCQGMQTAVTCEKDANGCFYAASTSTCASPQSCSGPAPSAACSLTCTNSCTSGQTSCVNGQLATCTLGSNGCYSYGTPVACGTHQSCTGAAGAGACTCNADPVCTAMGSACANPTTLATCTKDPQNCVYASATLMCAQPSPDCQQATCTCLEAVCGGSCVNTQSDSRNCGACGYACVNGRTCQSGRCTPAWLPISTTSAPTARTGSVAVGVAGTMVIAGGSPAVPTTNVYDSASDTWPAASPMGTARCQHKIVSSGTYAYAFGGLTDCNNGAALAQGFEEYTPSTRSWTAINASGAASARYAFGMTWAGSEVFVYGGSNATTATLASGARYNASSGTWSDASCSLPQCERVNPVLFAAGGVVFLWGGAFGNSPAGLQYGLSSGMWSSWSVPGGVLPGGSNPDDDTRIFVVSTSGTGCTQTTSVQIYSRATGTLLLTDKAAAPNGVIGATAIVWSGSEVIAWSGGCGATPGNGGGRYQPAAP